MSAMPSPSSSLWAEVLEGVPDGVLICDLEGRIGFVSREAAAMTGYAPGQLIGRSVDMLVPNQAQELSLARPGATLRRPEGHAGGVQVSLRRQDGTEFPAQVTLNPITIDGQVRIIAAFRDVTAALRTQRRLAAVLAISEATLGGERSAAILPLIAAHARTIVDGSLAVIAQPSPDSNTMLAAAADGEGAERLRGLTFPIENSLDGRVLTSHKPLLIENLAQSDPVVHPALRGTPAGSLLIVLLSAATHSFGTLSVYCSDIRQPLTAQDMTVLQVFAAQTALALEYIRVRDEVHSLAILDDRERIARELHDGAIQALFGVGMSLQSGAAMTNDRDLQKRLESAVNSLDHVIRDLRNSIFTLRTGIVARGKPRDRG